MRLQSIFILYITQLRNILFTSSSINQLTKTIKESIFKVLDFP